MSQKDNANEPAYPCNVVNCCPSHADFPDGNIPGLTKREEFAKAALIGQLSHPQSTGDPQTCAEWAVKCADALLAELAKKP